MKPSIPEIGKVIRIEDDSAIVMFIGDSCKGCGQAEIGLCKVGGTPMFFKVKNPIDAKVGDSVKVGIDNNTKIKGYFLAFIIPLISLVMGALFGYVLGQYLFIQSLEIISAFVALILTSLVSFKRLKRLDSTSSISIKSIMPEMSSGSVLCDDPGRYFLN
jgi:sigma-E factor negative regulatory protein RseC